MKSMWSHSNALHLDHPIARSFTNAKHWQFVGFDLNSYRLCNVTAFAHYCYSRERLRC